MLKSINYGSQTAGIKYRNAIVLKSMQVITRHFFGMIAYSESKELKLYDKCDQVHDKHKGTH
jgi:hypothetical protein